MLAVYCSLLATSVPRLELTLVAPASIAIVSMMSRSRYSRSLELRAL